MTFKPPILPNINKDCDHILKPDLLRDLSAKTGISRKKLDIVMTAWTELLKEYFFKHKIVHITGLGKFIYVPYRKRVISNLLNKDLGIFKGNSIKFILNPDFSNRYKEKDQERE